MSRRTKALFTLVLPSALFTALVGWVAYLALTRAPAPRPDFDARTPVRVAKAVRGDIHRFVALRGDVLATREAVVKAEVTGRVKAIAFKAGDFTSQVRAETGNGSSDGEVRKPLMVIGFDNIPVVAPFPGIIVRKLVEDGDWVSPGTPLFEIHDASAYRVRVGLTERERGLLKKGQRAWVVAPSIDAEHSLLGRVDTVSAATGNSRLYDADILLTPQPDWLREARADPVLRPPDVPPPADYAAPKNRVFDRLVSSLSARLWIDVNTYENVLSIPSGAITLKRLLVYDVAVNADLSRMKRNQEVVLVVRQPPSKSNDQEKKPRTLEYHARVLEWLPAEDGGGVLRVFHRVPPAEKYENPGPDSETDSALSGDQEAKAALRRRVLRPPLLGTKLRVRESGSMSMADGVAGRVTVRAHPQSRHILLRLMSLKDGEMRAVKRRSDRSSKKPGGAASPRLFSETLVPLLLRDSEGVPMLLSGRFVVRDNAGLESGNMVITSGVDVAADRGEVRDLGEE